MQAELDLDPSRLRLMPLTRNAPLASMHRLNECGIGDGATVHAVQPRRGWLYFATRGQIIEVRFAYARKGS